METITEAYVLQFANNIFHLSQQKGSILQPFVRNESIQGKAKSFNRLGATAAQKKQGRHAPTPNNDIEHSTRWVGLVDYNWAHFVDPTDLMRMLIDPTSDYVMSAMWAFGRTKDDVIIAKAFAPAVTGEERNGSAIHPNTQKYAANNGTAFTNLNVKTLRAIRRMFAKQQVDKSLPLYFAYTSSQLEAMLGQTEVTSADYANVKALVQGEVETFMGFRFIEIERLLDTSGRTVAASATTGVVGAGASVAGTNFRSCIAWAGDGLLMATGQDVKTRIDERADLSYSTQAYGEMAIDAVRMEEEKVIEVICKED